MKYLQITCALIFFFLIQYSLISCPKCNRDFYKELLSNRSNTLGGKELLQAIENQQIDSQALDFGLPTAYNNQTDINPSKLKDAALSINNAKSEQSAHRDYNLYIYIILHIIFTGNIFS